MAATLAQTDVIEGLNLGAQTGIFEKSVSFSSGNPAANLAATSIGTGISGFLSSVRVQFGATAPDSLTVTITDASGHVLVTETVTASGSLYVEGEPGFVNGLSVACADNTTNSASAVITVVYHV